MSLSCSKATCRQWSVLVWPIGRCLLHTRELNDLLYTQNSVLYAMNSLGSEDGHNAIWLLKTQLLSYNTSSSLYLCQGSICCWGNTTRFLYWLILMWFVMFQYTEIILIYLSFISYIDSKGTLLSICHNSLSYNIYYHT